MTNYKILFANKAYTMNNLQCALDYAKRESLVGYRVSVFEGEKKLATYQGGDLKHWGL